MPELVLHRPLPEADVRALRTVAHGLQGEARLRDRARIGWLSHDGHRVREIVALAGISEPTVRHWITRCNAQGLAGRADAPRTGRPPTSTPEAIGTVSAPSLMPPQDRNLPVASGTLDRLAAYLPAECGIASTRSRIGELLQADGVRWRTQETGFGALPPSPQQGGDRRPRRDATRQARRDLPRRDGPGVGHAASRAPIDPARSPSRPAGARPRRSTMADGARGRSSGPCPPATGEACTAPAGRPTARWVEFLEPVEGSIAEHGDRVYAMLAKLSAHRAADVRRWSRADPRWEVVVQPTSAADLNRIAPWCK
ncbi:MAG: helix-turn-helix domain-containing protein, partial [Chloroflexota bacterium]|nr:helix-turn-helix domain-containing protein [Chloroflexota bacterium]